MKIAGYVEERGATPYSDCLSGSPGIYQYHIENLPVLEIKCDLFLFCHFLCAESES